ncbi:MAG: type II secretion system F family protein [Clostridia bacterium]|nr:type II secretion system F family protein [Clostridia bacterium]
MATFNYRALTEDGRIVSNKVEEGNKITLIHKLKNNGLYPISINQLGAKRNRSVKKRKNVSSINSTIEKINTNININDNRRKLTLKDRVNNYIGTTDKITDRDIAIFTQNFYLLKKANFNNIHALTTVIDSTENLTFAEILEDILAGVEAGDYMYKTMEYYSNIFPYIYINMIRVGELSGSLENALLQAVEYLDSTAAITKKLKGILIPNIAQFALLIVMLFVGTLFALPQVEKVFEEVGTKSTLPAITIWFQGVVNAMLKYWPVPTIILVIAIGGLVAYIQTPKGKYKYHYFKYTMPIFGKLIFSLDFSRIMKAMLLNLRNGMRIQESIEVSKNVTNNYVMLSIIENSIKNIMIGQSWIEPFERSGLASPMITEMLKIGMQTDLTEMMEKLVEYMEIDINNTLEKIMKTLPQVMYGIVGIVLIFFVIVVVVPMVQVYMGNFLFEAYL